jgi:hypothetical protein
MNFIIRSLLFLGAVIAGLLFFHAEIQTLFLANFLFNIFISCVFLLGLIFSFHNLLLLFKEESLLRKGVFSEKKLFLSPILLLIDRPLISHERVHKALAEVMDFWKAKGLITRYLASSLVFLGLLGTLWGLSETVVQISSVISDLPSGSMEADFFELLKTQLKKPLSGMGIAFSSSLLGLSGSLLLGFLEIQIEKARKQFLSALSLTVFKKMKITALSDASESGPDLKMVHSMLASWIDGIQKLQKVQITHEKKNQDFLYALISLTEKTNQLADLMKMQHTVLNKWAEEQVQTRRILENVASKMYDLSSSGDEVVKEYLNQISVNSRELLRCFSEQKTDFIDVFKEEMAGFFRNFDQNQKKEGKK